MENTLEHSERITLDPEDLRFIGKYTPAIQRGKEAEETVFAYVRAILRRTGNGGRNFTVNGKHIIFDAAPKPVE